MNIIEWEKEKIKGILSTFNRVIIKGYSLQLSNVRQMGYFLSHNSIGSCTKVGGLVPRHIKKF